jgi:hypothetical protein
VNLRSAAIAVVIVASVSLCVAAVDKETAFIGARGRYWAYKQVVRPAVPASTDSWARSPIDAFILKLLSEKHLAPAPPLPRVPLIRRVTYDLTGLPPTPEEVDAFVQDRSANAYEKVVDRLLASPHYGERWAGKWLDVVRYADTNGFELDQDRPHAWRYRDYVIQSFNADKSYKRATRRLWSPPAICELDQSISCLAISTRRKAVRKCSRRSPRMWGRLT